jgi:hypothetical protein
VSRGRNKRIGLANGTRRAVIAAEQPQSKNLKAWWLTLDCGHRMWFMALEAPKRVRCEHGCTAHVESAI